MYMLVCPQSDEKFELINQIDQKYARELDNEPAITKFVKKMLTWELYPMDEKELE